MRYRTQSRVPMLVFASGFLAVAVAMTGCGGAKLANLWKDPDYPKAPMKHVLVVSITRDPLARRIWEDNMSEALREYSVKTVSSYSLFPSELPDTQQVVEAVRRDGYDGVVVLRRLPTETSTQYVPGYTTTRPVTMMDHWSGAYYTHYEEVYRPGYTETEEVVRHQVDVWSTLDGGRMVWCGSTRNMNPSSIDNVREEVTALIVPELVKTGVIVKP